MVGNTTTLQNQQLTEYKFRQKKKMISLTNNRVMVNMTEVRVNLGCLKMKSKQKLQLLQFL